MEDNYVYIGKSESVSQEPYNRFMHEINLTTSTRDTSDNYTLTFLYGNSVYLKLEIFKVNKVGDIEKNLITAHKELFGYRPIGNGQDGNISVEN